MSYTAGQYGFPQSQAEGDANSTISDSELGLAMPQGYQVKTSPSRKSPKSEERLVMLAKYPHVSNDEVENALQQRDMKKQQQEQQRRNVGSMNQLQPAPPVPVSHTGQKEQPSQVTSHQDFDYHPQSQDRAGFQQGGYTGTWEESPPPSTPQNTLQAPKKKKSVLGRFVSKILPSGEEANSHGDDESRDNSYAKSYASESTRKVSNVNKKAQRQKRNGRMETISERKSCLACMFKSRTGIIISALIVALVLAGILTAAAMFWGGGLDKKEASVNDVDGVETWIPRPQDDDERTETPTAFPTGLGTGELPDVTPTFPTTTAPIASEVSTPTSKAPTPPPTMPPTPPPTPGPTPNPTPSPTPFITNAPPTRRPTLRPTLSPSKQPTTLNPTPRPSKAPTESPSFPPTTQSPTIEPTSLPTGSPTYFLRDLLPLAETLSGTVSEEKFGYAVSLSGNGNVVAVGSPFANVMGASSMSQAGKVQVFEFRNNAWSVRGFPLTGRNPQDKFGSAVALSDDGSILVVSEPTYGGEVGDRSGNVRAFVYDAGTGQYTPFGQELEGSAATDHFGISISLSKDGRRLAVGAPYHDNTVGSDRLVSGEVKTFEFRNNLWVPLGNPLAGESHFDWFGWKVDLNDAGDTMCVGAPRNLEFGGYVSCYEYVDSGWRSMGSSIRNTIQPLRYDDNFGHSLSISGDRVAVGSPGKNNRALDSGLVAVYEFDRPSRSWRRIGNAITSSSPVQSEQLGFAVSLKSDTLAVSTPGKNNRGQVDLYYYDPSLRSWQVSPNPLIGTTGSNFGFSLDMTARVAIGSAVNSGLNAGLVDVFYQP